MAKPTDQQRIDRLELMVIRIMEFIDSLTKPPVSSMAEKQLAVADIKANKDLLKQEIEDNKPKP